jgi:tRNA threonylcarbamoyladenosine biosynthesis protein TsaB
MSLILQLETATTSCSVALALNGNVIALRELNERNAHASHITLFIEQVLSESGKTMADLSAVAVSKGPGSYTGLRIGVSTAKGLCYALDIPLIAVNTLEAMASNMIKSGKFDSSILFCPMIDARRMEVYTAIFDSTGNEISAIEAKIINEDSFFDLLQESKIVFFGDGAEKCKDVLGKSSNSIIITDFINSARDLSGLALNKFNQKGFEDIAYFEPFYLKDFLATQPKIN